LYRFTDEPVFAHPKLQIVASPATNDWCGFETIAAAEAAIRTAHKNAKTGEKRQSKNRASVQPVAGVDTTNASAYQKTASPNELGAQRSIRRLKAV
jgi:hypothetical protein